MIRRNKQKFEQKPVAYTLAILFGITALLHIIAIVSQNAFPTQWFAQHGGLFDLDNERNVPTVYNGLLWGASAFMALLLAIQPQALIARLRWVFLSGLFFYFGFDEILVVHERLAEPVRDFLNISNGSIFYHAWIVPAIIVAVGIGILYKLTATKPRPSAQQKTTLKLVVILAFGVIALEAIGTQLYFSQLYYKLGPVMVEELFEIGMISLILYKLTTYVLDKR